jgi:hypothetical protein
MPRRGKEFGARNNFRAVKNKQLRAFIRAGANRPCNGLSAYVPADPTVCAKPRDAKVVVFSPLCWTIPNLVSSQIALRGHDIALVNLAPSVGECEESLCTIFIGIKLRVDGMNLQPGL